MHGTSLPGNARVFIPSSACPSPVSLIKGIDTVDHGYTSADTAIPQSYFLFGSADLAAMPKASVVYLTASDANPVAFNPMPAGTVVTVASTKGLASSVDGGSPVPSTLSPTSVAIGYAFDDTTTEGLITVTFTTPRGACHVVLPVHHNAAEGRCLPVIALVGMPGSGKSTGGRQLARQLGLEFVDSDHVVEDRLGMPIQTGSPSTAKRRFATSSRPSSTN